MVEAFFPSPFLFNWPSPTFNRCRLVNNYLTVVIKMEGIARTCQLIFHELFFFRYDLFLRRWKMELLMCVVFLVFLLYTSPHFLEDRRSRAEETPADRLKTLLGERTAAVPDSAVT